MGKKYFTLSWDDGLEQDKRIVELMRKYGLKGTFNLNAGKMGLKAEVHGLGTLMFKDDPDGIPHKKPFKYVRHDQIPEDEINQVYAGMEIASHGYMHLGPGRIDASQYDEELGQDIKRLEEITGQEIVGHAYAYGSTNDAAQKYLAGKGIVYARGVMSSNNFKFPDNPMNFRPTTSFMSKTIFKLAEQFKAADVEEDLLFYVWGHGYECDLNAKYASYEHLERFFDAISGDGGITYCTNAEAFMHI